MPLEVEQKYRCEDFAAVVQRLAALGATEAAPVDQSDCYYRHPTRDFARTDEAFRLRSAGPQNFFTYKGPKLDAETKTRYEQEIPLADGADAQAAADDLVRRLGFEPVATVRKRRRRFHLDHAGREFEAAIDSVDQVGQFVELETQAEGSPDDEAAAAAKQALADLATQLGLTEVERRSYLEMLLG